jgi:hypothetical protein
VDAGFPKDHVPTKKPDHDPIHLIGSWSSFNLGFVEKPSRLYCLRPE